MSKKLMMMCCLFAMTAFIQACTKEAEGVEGPAGPPGEAGLPATNVRSAITGYVNLYSQFHALEETADSVTVTTKMGDSLIKTTTNASGFFRIPNLKSGEYRILFTKDGYDSIGVNIKHSAGNEDHFINITALTGTLTSTFYSQAVDLSPDVNYPAFNIATITTLFYGPPVSDNTPRALAIYFSRSPEVSSKNYLYRGEGYSSGLGINFMVSYIGFQGSEIRDANFNVGDTVYMKTYFVPWPNYNTSWFDSNSYQTIPYPYVGDSLNNYFIWQN